MAKTPFLNVGRTSSRVSVDTGKGAQAVLVGLVAFTAYLYLTGRLTNIAKAIGGAQFDERPIGQFPRQGPFDLKEGETPDPLEPGGGMLPPPVDWRLPSNKLRKVTVPHKRTGKPVSIGVLSGFGCELGVERQLVALAGYSLQDAKLDAPRICADSGATATAIR